MTVRLGFLGAGFIARHHLRMLAGSGTDHAVTVVYDRDRRRAETFAAEVGQGIEVVDDEAAALEGVDAVYVCTWTSEHPRLVDAIAERGLGVFCEKPLATDLAGAAAMTATVERAGVVNQVGLVLRDSPAFHWVRHLLGRAEAGRVQSVVLRDDQYLPIRGQYGSTWRAERDKAGAGTLLEHSIHDLDLLEWVCGPITSLTARSASFHAIEGIEDTMVLTVSFASGAIGTLSSIWHDHLGRESSRRLEVFCERALVTLEGDVWGPVRWSPTPEVTAPGPGLDAGPEVPADEELARGALVEAWMSAGGVPRNPDGAFVDAVASGQAAQPSFRTALRAHRLVDAAYRSAAAGGIPVELPSAAR